VRSHQHYNGGSGAAGLEGQADNLPAALAPEKLVKIIPEKESDLFRVLANPYDIELFQTIHQTNKYTSVDDILETCVKVFQFGENRISCQRSIRF